MSKLISFILINFCLIFASCLKENEDVRVNLYELSLKYVGKKGTLSIEADSDITFDIDISRKTYFQAEITDENNIFNVNCGLWKAIEGYFYIFCNLGTDIPAGNYSIDFNDIPSFNYQENNITLFPYSNKYEFEKLDQDLIDLYSEVQTINIEEDKDFYELKFNVVSYNKEVVMIGNQYMDCKQEKNELICQTKKIDLEMELDKIQKKMYINFINDKIGAFKLPLAGPIIIKDNITQKTDVFVGITKLIENVADTNKYIAYETNITNISKVLTSIKNLELYFENDKAGEYKSGCLLKKNDGFPLFLVCLVPYNGTSWLSEIKQEKVIDEANIRYNFRIQPVKNEEKIYSGGNGGINFIIWSYPEILNFTTTDNLYIDYSAKHPNGIKGITFNEDKEDLSCEVRQNGLLRCTIPKNHFEGKESGYYFAKHTNHLGGKTTFFESNPIKVILPEPDPTPSKGSIHSIFLYYSFILILIIF